MREAKMDELIVRVANAVGSCADEREIRAMLLAETNDEGLSFLLLQAGRILAAPLSNEES
jgi:hypothetical protein